MSFSKKFLALFLLSTLLPACNSMGTKPQTQSAVQLTDIAEVKCMLPNELKKLSDNIIYYAPARPIKTSVSDCHFRGGQLI